MPDNTSGYRPPTFGSRFRDYFWKPGASGMSNAGRILRAAILGPVGALGAATRNAGVGEGVEAARNAIARRTYDRREAQGALGPVPEGAARGAGDLGVSASTRPPTATFADPRNLEAGPPRAPMYGANELAAQLAASRPPRATGPGVRGGNVLAEGQDAVDMAGAWRDAARAAMFDEADRRWRQRSSMIEK